MKHAPDLVLFASAVVLSLAAGRLLRVRDRVLAKLQARLDGVAL